MNSVVKSAQCSVCRWDGGWSRGSAPVLARPWALRGLMLLQVPSSLCKRQRKISFLPVCSVCHPDNTPKRGEGTQPCSQAGFHCWDLGTSPRAREMHVPCELKPDGFPRWLKARCWPGPRLNEISHLQRLDYPWDSRKSVYCVTRW